MMPSLLAAARGGGGGFPVPAQAEPFTINASGGGWPGLTQVVHYGDKTWFGTTDGDNGHVLVGEFTHSTGVTTLTTVHTFTADVHNSPAILRRSSDGRLITVYCDHDQGALYQRLSTNPDDATAWGSESNIDGSVGGTLYTYPWLIELPDEGTIKIFMRNKVSGSSKWSHSSSFDDGATWSNTVGSTMVDGLRYYGRSYQSDDDRIDFMFTDGSYAEDFASLYHLVYKSGGLYYQSDGTQIFSEPFTVAELTKVYDGASAGVRYPADLIRDTATGDIVCVFPVQTGTPTNHVGQDEDYLYARWNGSAWAVHTVVAAVGANTLEFTDGDLSIDPDDINRLLVSARDVDDVWQMYEYRTSDAGASWSVRQLTDGTDHQISPSFSKGHDDVLQAIWMSGSSLVSQNDWSAGVVGFGV